MTESRNAATGDRPNSTEGASIMQSHHAVILFLSMVVTSALLLVTIASRDGWM
jgi:hypothetical protein